MVNESFLSEKGSFTLLPKLLPLLCKKAAPLIKCKAANFYSGNWLNLFTSNPMVATPMTTIPYKINIFRPPVCIKSKKPCLGVIFSSDMVVDVIAI